MFTVFGKDTDHVCYSLNKKQAIVAAELIWKKSTLEKGDTHSKVSVKYIADFSILTFSIKWENTGKIYSYTCYT